MISVTGVGNLVSDPVIKEVGDTRVARFSIASNRNIKRGDKYEKIATFLDCESWGGITKVIERWAKGDTIMVDGELEQQTWEKDGVNRSKHVLRVDKAKGIKTKDRESVATTEEDAPF